jgi:hypothetical protein
MHGNRRVRRRGRRGLEPEAGKPDGRTDEPTHPADMTTRESYEEDDDKRNEEDRHVQGQHRPNRRQLSWSSAELPLHVQRLSRSSRRCATPSERVGVGRTSQPRDRDLHPAKGEARDIDPEKELANYKYSKLFAGNGLVFHTELDKFREILARLSDAVKGEPKHWIARVELHAGSKIMFWLDQVVRGEPKYTWTWRPAGSHSGKRWQRC